MAILGGFLAWKLWHKTSPHLPSRPRVFATAPKLIPVAAPVTQTFVPSQPVDPKPLPDFPKPPPIHARAAILVDAADGQVLYAHNPDLELPMASCTKIMTALVFCERVPDDAIIVASKRAASTPQSSMHLKVGERLTAHDLLRALLLRSANDGAVAAAEKAAGSVEAFVALMNQKAAELGCTHTHFMNPHGLTQKGHYTTARDLATIARAAMKVPRIREVVGLTKAVIQRSIDKHDVVMQNHTHFVGHFPGADGIKTGWTVPAGHCFVGSDTRNGWELISVVLNCPHFVKDTEALMNYGFHNFEPHVLEAAGQPVGVCSVVHGVMPRIPVRTADRLEVVLPKKAHASLGLQMRLNPISAPVQPGEKVGEAIGLVNGVPVVQVPLVAAFGDGVAVKELTKAPSSSWPPLLRDAAILALCLVSFRYVAGIGAFAKGARRRWSRLS